MIYTVIENKVQSFDIMNEKWLTLPSTFMNYSMRPIVWNDEYNHNLLFIGSFTYNNGLEYIDLREGKTWNIIKIDHKRHALSEVFGIELTESYWNATLCLNST